MISSDPLCGFVETKIRTAISGGAFDNLPGKGKPLNLEDQTHVKPRMRLAFHLLREADLVPAWLERQKDLRAEIQRFRMELRRSITCPEPGMDQTKYADLKAECDRLNKAVRNTNLDVPIISLHIHGVDFERE
jgi:hypothetical protein